MPDIRRSITWLIAILAAGRADATAFQFLTFILGNMEVGTFIYLGYEISEDGRWTLSSQTLRQKKVFHAAMHVASCDLQLLNVVAVRLGSGTARIISGRGYNHRIGIWWTNDGSHELFHHSIDPTLVHTGQSLFGDKGRDTLWFQTLVSDQTLQGIQAVDCQGRDEGYQPPHIGRPHHVPDYPQYSDDGNDMEDDENMAADKASTSRTSLDVQAPWSDRSWPEPRGTARKRDAC